MSELSIDIILSVYVFQPLAIVFGLICFNRISPHSKALAVFLLWGFISDNKRLFVAEESLLPVYYFYVLSEILFMLWFIQSLTDHAKVRNLFGPLLAAVGGFWFYCFLSESDIPLQSRSLPGIFDLTTAGLIAFISAFGLFRLTYLKGRLERNPTFWYLTGIFLYFMAGNFLFTFASKAYVQSIWIIPRIMGICFHVCLIVGFILEFRSARAETSSCSSNSASG